MATSSVLSRPIALWISLLTCVSAGPRAVFRGEDIVLRDGGQRFVIPAIIDSHANYSTIHSVLRRKTDYFIVYGTSELTRGWPPKSANCGCGIESYIRWLHIRDGKIVAEQKGLYQSCAVNRDGWIIEWKDGKLIWQTEGQLRVENSGQVSYTMVKYTWTFDPSKPDAGITETQEPAK